MVLPFGKTRCQSRNGCQGGVTVRTDLTCPWGRPGSWWWLRFMPFYCRLIPLLPRCSLGQTQQGCGSAEAPSRTTSGWHLGPGLLGRQRWIPAMVLALPLSLLSSSSSTWVLLAASHIHLQASSAPVSCPFLTNFSVL